MDKERLKKYRAIKREAEQLRQQIEEVEAALYAPRAQQLTGMPSNPSPTNAMEALVEKRAELQALYTSKYNELTAEQLTIEKAIDSLEPTARTVLRCHYIQGHVWEEVCCIVGYSWSQTHRIHARALKELKSWEG